MQQRERVTLLQKIQIWPYVPLISRKVPCFYSEKCSAVQRHVVSSDTASVSVFCSFLSSSDFPSVEKQSY